MQQHAERVVIGTGPSKELTLARHQVVTLFGYGTRWNSASTCKSFFNQQKFRPP